MNLQLNPQWMLEKDGKTECLSELLKLLAAIGELGSISRAATTMGLSYRHAWGLLRQFETDFSVVLLRKSRGQGALLTPLAEKLIWADRRINARLYPLLNSFASEIESIIKGAPATRITASHGFAVDALVKWLDAENVPFEINYRSSMEAVAALSRNECEMAGFHVPVGEFHAAGQPYLKFLDPARHALIHLAYRMQGLFVAKGNPRQITGLRDLVRKDVRFVNRQTGTGTRILLELLLAKEGIDVKDIADYDTVEYTHSAIAAFVASNMADVGFGVETAARRFDLDFIPLVQENYLFACQSAAIDEAQPNSICEILKSKPVRDQLNRLPGYDARRSGETVSFDEVFANL